MNEKSKKILSDLGFVNVIIDDGESILEKRFDNMLILIDDKTGVKNEIIIGVYPPFEFEPIAISFDIGNSQTEEITLPILVEAAIKIANNLSEKMLKEPT